MKPMLARYAESGQGDDQHGGHADIGVFDGYARIGNGYDHGFSRLILAKLDEVVKAIKESKLSPGQFWSKFSAYK